MEIKKRVLIVDDEKAIRDSVSELIKEEGYFVVTAPDFELAMAQSKEVDCIILDLQLSPKFEMEGGTFLKHVWKDIWCDVPIIVYSGFLGIMGIDEDLKQIERLCGKGRNIFRCIPKSSGVNLLIAAVNECLKKNSGGVVMNAGK
jgi:CheY-like chemotaxis protein